MNFAVERRQRGAMVRDAGRRGDVLARRPAATFAGPFLRCNVTGRERDVMQVTAEEGVLDARSSFEFAGRDDITARVLSCIRMVARRGRHASQVEAAHAALPHPSQPVGILRSPVGLRRRVPAPGARPHGPQPLRAPREASGQHGTSR